MGKIEYEYEIANCFEDGVILVKTEQQAQSIAETLKRAYNSPFTYKRITDIPKKSNK